MSTTDVTPVRLSSLWNQRDFTDVPSYVRLALVRALSQTVPQPSDPKPRIEVIFPEALRLWESQGAEVSWELITALQGFKIIAVYDNFVFDHVKVDPNTKAFVSLEPTKPIWRWSHYTFARDVFYELLLYTSTSSMASAELIYRRLMKLALSMAIDAEIVLSDASLRHLHLALYERIVGLEADAMQNRPRYRELIGNTSVSETRQSERTKKFALLIAGLKSIVERSLRRPGLTIRVTPDPE